MQILEGMKNRYVPLNDWIHETLRPYAERIIHGKNRYTLVFDKLEILIALSFAYHEKKSADQYRAPLGIFGYRPKTRDQILQEVGESLSKKQNESPFVTCGIFGRTAEECKQGLEALEQFISEFAWRR